MQIKMFSIPIVGGEKLSTEMNKFLRSKKVLQVDNHIVNQGSSAFWCFCVKYMDAVVEAKTKPKTKVDYRDKLDEKSFDRYQKYREIRKEIAEENNTQLYFIFTNEELAEMAKIEKLTEKALKEIKGIGEKKIKKYGQRFILEI